MPTTTWNTTTINGKDFLVISSAEFRIPLDWDPSSNMFIAVAAPSGGLGNFPALVKGDTGDAPTLSTPSFTALESTDPTADSATWTETSPGTWRLNLALHKGPKGDTGDTVLDPADYASPAAKKILQVNATVDAFELVAPKVGDRHVPASIANTPAGNPTYTLCAVSIPAYPFDWRPRVEGQAVITPYGWGGSRIDLIARLNNETAGNEVGRAFGYGTALGTVEITEVLSAGPPTNASSTYDKVSAGATATVYLRAERVTGSGTFTTSSDTTRFCVYVEPIP